MGDGFYVQMPPFYTFSPDLTWSYQVIISSIIIISISSRSSSNIIIIITIIMTITITINHAKVSKLTEASKNRVRFLNSIKLSQKV